MESTLHGKRYLSLLLFFALLIIRPRAEESQNNVEKSNRTSNEVVVNDKRRNPNGGGGAGWGWGGGGGGSNGRGGWGWGGGGGGGVYWQWGCKNRRPGKRGHRFPLEDFKIGEFAQCMVKGRCKGMRLDCPLHCGGPCFYDCRHMCKAHCRR